MDILNGNTMIGPLVVKTPAYAKHFEKLGLDYCCKGKQTLKELCNDKNLNLSEVLEQLNEIPISSATENFEKLSVNDLIAHIVKKHHDYLRKELPRLSGLIDKVTTKHSGRHSELLELRDTFEKLKKDVFNHIKKEEVVVFPTIEKLTKNKTDSTCSDMSLENYLKDLDAEHLETGAALEKMNRLTNGYRPPSGACATYHVMLDSLSYLERDMHEHVHKEKHILFPKAVKEFF